MIGKATCFVAVLAQALQIGTAHACNSVQGGMHGNEPHLTIGAKCSSAYKSAAVMKGMK